MEIRKPSVALVSVVVVLLAAACSRPPTAEPQGEVDETVASTAMPAPVAVDLSELGIEQLQRLMQDGTLTSRRVTQWYLDRIAAIDDDGPKLNAVIAVNPDALGIADRLDAERRAGTLRGPLHGIPVLLKDNIDTGDRELTTAGSLAMAAAPAPRDAEVSRRLREAGAVILGKANLSEWANFRSERSSSGWSAVGGQTRNPYVLDRSPCGSSSGSAVAVSANLVVVAVGTETDGSVVCPASVNGIVGFKPTVGLVSRRGIVPIALSQDTAGPMARTVADAAILLDAMAGSDPGDGATARADANRVGFRAALDSASLKGRRIGIVRRIGGEDDRGRPVLESVVATLRTLGADVVDPVELRPDSEYGTEEFTVLLYEFKAQLDEYLKARAGTAPASLADVIAFNEREAVRELVWFGQETLIESQGKGGLGSAEYRRALESSRRLAGAQGIDAAMKKYRLDALVALTEGPAWTIDLVNGDNGSGFGSSSPAAVAGYPSITVPAGFVHGLPVGVSFFAGAWRDAQVLALAHAFEHAHKARRPPTYLPSLPYDPVAPGGR